ncbi:MAG: phosphohydrolase [Oscillospiraceae bacterium]|jgi:5'-deoxynucleotidase YfbR-like HD superfamily hydrolase
MGCLLTYSGISFDPFSYTPDQIRIGDIAHSLSHQCRAMGHSRIFYSVAQHSLACAFEASCRGLSDRIALGCLLHDGSEAYLSDIVRPIKPILSEYEPREREIQLDIWKKFMGSVPTPEEEKLIFGIDDDMLAFEFHSFMAHELDGGEYVRKVSEKIVCRVEDFDEVADRFTAEAGRLGRNLK